MNTKVISVIIPVYNTNKDDLKKCLYSVINQNYKDLEIIVIDDGSTKSIKNYCDYLSKIDSRIIVYHNENHGVSWTRNFGFEKCKGEYISFIDSDDILEEDMYKILVNNIVKYNCDISICGYNYIELDGKVYPKYNTGNEICFDNKNAIISMFDDQSFGVSVWNKLFKKEVIDKIKFDEKLNINEDRLFLFESLCNCKKVCYNDICLYNYIKRHNSATTSKFSSKRFDVLTVNNRILEYVLLNFSKYDEIINKFYKNESIYLIRLYRELILNSNKSEFIEEKKEIKLKLKNLFKNVKKQLNSFEHIEIFLIVKTNIIYSPIIKFFTKMTFLKKIKNCLQRKENKK